MLAAWKKKDLPESRVKLIPITVTQRILYTTQHLPNGSELLMDAANMVIIALFYLLCLGKYTDSPFKVTRFTIGDVQLMMMVGDIRPPITTSSDVKLAQTCSILLRFTHTHNTEKWSKNKVITQG